MKGIIEINRFEVLKKLGEGLEVFAFDYDNDDVTNLKYETVNIIIDETNNKDFFFFTIVEVQDE